MLSREEILGCLRGKEVVIPDLFTIFHGWVQVEINPHYQKLIAVSNDRLERWMAQLRLIVQNSADLTQYLRRRETA
jgi:hypothetical protein